MLKTNGAGPVGQVPDRAYLVKYACPCGHSHEIQIPVYRNTSAVTVPELQCAKCKGLPTMARSNPLPIEVSRVVQPTLVPPRISKVKS